MEISEEKILDLAEREMRMYCFDREYRKGIVGTRFRFLRNRLLLEVVYEDGSGDTICSGKDFYDLRSYYLEFLNDVWGTDSPEEFEILLESWGF